MRIYYRTGIELPAGIIRQLIPGHADHGETSPAELQRVMQIFKLKPVSAPVGKDAVKLSLMRAIMAGIPPLILGTWLAPTTLHWVLGVAASAEGVTVNDPWDGKRRVYPWPLLTSRYAGWVIL